MGSIASGMFYLASPLAMAGPAPAVGAGTFATDAIAAPLAMTIATHATPRRPYFVIDAPAINRLRVTFLDKDIIDAVARRADADRTEAPGAMARWTDAGTAPVEGDIADAVVAAHEQRIALLRQRLDTLAAGTVAPPLVRDLRARLHRAEAARRLAIARVDPGAHPPAPVRHAAARDATASPASAAVRHDDGRDTRHGYRSALATRHHHHGAALLASPRQSAQVAPGVARSPVTHAASAPRAGGDHAAEPGLARARRSLAVARSLLDDRADTAAAPPSVQLAGLMQWPGSAAWTLATHHSRY